MIITTSHALTLKGFVNPIGDYPAFLIPVFYSEDRPFIQSNSKNDLVQAFTEMELENDILMPLNGFRFAAIVNDNLSLDLRASLQTNLGHASVYAFGFSPSDVVVGTRKALVSALRSDIDKLKGSPFVLLEVCSFIKDPILTEYALDGARTQLIGEGLLSPERAEQWVRQNRANFGLEENRPVSKQDATEPLDEQARPMHGRRPAMPTNRSLTGTHWMVLRAVIELRKDTAGFATDDEIAHYARMSVDDVRERLDTLAGESFVETIRTANGFSASITPMGRLASWHSTPTVEIQTDTYDVHERGSHAFRRVGLWAFVAGIIIAAITLMISFPPQIIFPTGWDFTNSPRELIVSKIGPSGGGTAVLAGGDSFEDNTIPGGAKVVGIRVKHDGVVNGLQLVYSLNGQEYSLPMHGGEKGIEEIFRLDKDEHITAISGRTGTGLDSITFHTNKRQSKRFGGGGGTDSYYFISPGNGEVIGFWGKAREVALTQIGVLARSK